MLWVLICVPECVSGFPLLGHPADWNGPQLGLMRQRGLACIGIHHYRKYCQQALTVPNHPSWMFWLDDQGLGVREIHVQAPQPVRVDFVDATLQWRIRHGGGFGEMLARACRIRPNEPIRICDATAGWCQDTSLLLSLGAEVWLCERSTWMQWLIEDGILRAAHDPEHRCTWLGQLHWTAMSALHWLPSVGRGACDVVYLDPMYPDRQRQARPSKAMAVLHQMLPDDLEQEPELLTSARQVAKQRVVVKRPRHAPFMAEIQPHHQVLGQSSRFDIYLP